jgi:hypothetical protein
MDVREILKDYITIKDQEYGSDILSKVTFPEGDTTEVTPPTTEPLATEPAPEAPSETGAPAEVPPAPAPQPAAESREHDDPPFDPDPKPSKKVTPGKNGQGYSQARHLARQGLKQAVEKAKKAGATSETIINVSGKHLTLAEVMEKIELAEAKEHKHKEIIEYVKSMFDETSGQFPKGEMGVKIAVEKKFGDEVGPLAEKIMGKLQSMNEMSRVKKLAGVSEGDNFTWSNDDNGKKTSGTDKAGYDNVMSKFKGMAGNMDTPFGKMDLSDPNTAAGNIHKGVQDKMSSMMKGMNMPGMDATPNMPGSSTPSSAPATKQDPKDVLKKLPPEKIQSMDGDQAKKMLADLKKMAGLAN